MRHALTVLAGEGLIVVRHGRTAVVAGEPPEPEGPGRALWRPGPGHDCALAGCRKHACSPLKPASIRQVHSILSGAFDAAQRWGWVDDNPMESAKPPTVTMSKRPAIPAKDVARVIAEARSRDMHAWCSSGKGGSDGGSVFPPVIRLPPREAGSQDHPWRITANVGSPPLQQRQPLGTLETMLEALGVDPEGEDFTGWWLDAAMAVSS